MRRSRSSKRLGGSCLFLCGLLCLGALQPAFAETEKSTPAATGIGAATGAASGVAAGGIAAPPNDPCFQDVLCKGHYQRARILSKAGELESALTEYQIAFKQQPVPWLLLNIARTLHKITKLPEAIEKYQRYLDMTQQNGDAELRAKAQEYLDQAKKELAERPPPEKEPPPAPLQTDPLLVGANRPDAKEKERTPVYKKWWFWTIIGVSAAAVAGGIAGGVIASQSKSTPVPMVPTDAEAYRPMF